jgi:hypothetical protein
MLKAGMSNRPPHPLRGPFRETNTIPILSAENSNLFDTVKSRCSTEQNEEMDF